MKQFISTITLVALFLSPALAQDEWIAPEDQSSKLSKFEFTDATREAGAALYLTNCKSCHGMPGEGNPVPLAPIAPQDPATEALQANTDGSLYYKIREGRGLMPSFKKVISIPDTWNLISYLRSFNPDYVQEIAIAAANNRWTDIAIKVVLMEAEHKIKAEVSGKEGEAITPVAGADVRMEAERRFGQLQVGEVVMTNNDGIAWFDAPKDLPGDEEGHLNLTILLDNEEEFGIVKTETRLKAGMPFTPVSLTEERAMWNTMRKAPIWLLMSYSLAVLAVWGLIFYVMFQLRAIFKLGEKQENQ